jgi:hypothetical protein
MKRTSAPRVAAITIAAIVPRETCEIPELKFGLATAIKITVKHGDWTTRGHALTKLDMQ